MLLLRLGEADTEVGVMRVWKTCTGGLDSVAAMVADEWP
jgi:hypothetical protein